MRLDEFIDALRQDEDFWIELREKIVGGEVGRAMYVPIEVFVGNEYMGHWPDLYSPLVGISTIQMKKVAERSIPNVIGMGGDATLDSYTTKMLFEIDGMPEMIMVIFKDSSWGDCSIDFEKAREVADGVYASSEDNVTFPVIL